MRRLRLLVLVPVALLVLGVAGVAGSFVYTRFLAGDAPARLTVGDTSKVGDTSTASTSATVATSTTGTWSVSPDSQAGYRVKEILFGQSAEAVGRTNAVTGEMAFDGASVSNASFTVDMTTVASDESRRDNQFKNRIMNVSTFPTATFELTRPIALASTPPDGETVSIEATGRLTLRGTTKTVTISLEAKKTGDRIEVAGNYTVVFADWNIPNPSFGPAQTDDHGELEFLLVLTKA